MDKEIKYILDILKNSEDQTIAGLTTSLKKNLDIDGFISGELKAPENTNILLITNFTKHDDLVRFVIDAYKHDTENFKSLAQQALEISIGRSNEAYLKKKKNGLEYFPTPIENFDISDLVPDLWEYKSDNEEVDFGNKLRENVIDNYSSRFNYKQQELFNDVVNVLKKPGNSLKLGDENHDDLIKKLNHFAQSLPEGAMVAVKNLVKQHSFNDK